MAQKCLVILCWLDTESAYQRKSGPPGGRTQNPRVTILTPADAPTYPMALVRVGVRPG